MMAVLALGATGAEVTEMEKYAENHPGYQYVGTCTEIKDIEGAKAAGKDISMVLVFAYRRLVKDDLETLGRMGIEVISYLAEQSVDLKETAYKRNLEREEVVDVSELELDD